MSEKLPKIIFIKSPVDFSKIREVPSMSKEKSFDSLMREFADAVYQFLSLCVGYDNELSESRNSNAPDNIDHIRPERKINVEDAQGKTIRKMTGEIAKELSVDPKNISRLIKQFNLKTPDHIILAPKKIGDGYITTQKVWDMFHKFVLQKKTH